MTLELKTKKIQAVVTAIRPRNDLHGDSFQTAATVNLNFLASAEFMDQLSGELVGESGYRDVFWKDHGGMFITGLSPLKFDTEFTYHRVRFRIGDNNTTIPSSKIDGLTCKPMDNRQVDVKLALKFECNKTLIADLSEMLQRPAGIGVTFMGENAQVREAASNQGDLELEQDDDKVVDINSGNGGDDDGAE